MEKHVFDEKVAAVMSDPKFIGSTSDAGNVIKEVYFLNEDLSETTEVEERRAIEEAKVNAN